MLARLVKIAATLSVVFAVLCGSALSGQAARPAVGAIAVYDVHHQLVHPLAATGRAATVLIFIARDCPISNSYAPEIQRLRADYALIPIRFYVVYVDGGAAKDVLAHAQAHGYDGFALRDPAHTLVRLTGARVTPEAAVLGPQGQVLYEGRIDDRFADLGRARDLASVHDLRRALDAVRAGKPVTVARTKAVGCDIPTT